MLIILKEQIIKYPVPVLRCLKSKIFYTHAKQTLDLYLFVIKVSKNKLFYNY